MNEGEPCDIWDAVRIGDVGFVGRSIQDVPERATSVHPVTRRTLLHEAADVDADAAMDQRLADIITILRHHNVCIDAVDRYGHTAQHLLQHVPVNTAAARLAALAP